MKHNRNPRFLALLLVLALVVLCILLAQPVRAVECRLQGKPEPEKWEPEEDDVAYISRTIWGEARGCSRAEKEAVAWCILNRVDDARFPNTIKAVVTAKWQFQGYSPNFPAEDFADIARDVLIRWHSGERGIDPSLCWFSGNGVYNTFRNAYNVEEATLIWRADT